MITAGRVEKKRPYNKSHKKPHHKRIHHKIFNASKQVVVCLVHANWCGHCQHLMPEWNKMEHNIKNNPKLSSNCKIVKIESEYVNKELPKYENMIKQKIQVEGYPTIFLIKGGQIQKYEGERTAEQIGGWVASEVNRHVGGKTRKQMRKPSKKNCKSCKSFNMFKLW
uniref:Thioredoxin domain-containing protein n=1 Tax=viral metagenome TaxID=1070528 RepID=A0A6C0DEP6_9ZZZZ